jgi:hypothetical protein
MRLPSSGLILTLLCGPIAAFAAQTPTTPPPAAAPAQTQPKTPSAILRPALDNLQQTLSTLRLDKWKASAAVREEADANISSIHHDLEATLPTLLATADAAPDSIVRVLPAYRNIEALYDVLLRVTAAGKLAAPSQQSAALDQTTASLDEARRALGDSLQASAITQEKIIVGLKAALRATPPPPAPAPAVTAPPPAPAKTHKPRPKPAQKPATAPVSTKPATPPPAAKP